MKWSECIIPARQLVISFMLRNIRRVNSLSTEPVSSTAGGSLVELRVAQMFCKNLRKKRLEHRKGILRADKMVSMPFMNAQQIYREQTMWYK